MQQPQQVHHLIPQSAGTSTQNRDHHQHSHPPKEMNKPKGRMSAYTFFVQKCRDEHRKAYPNENANFSEFSKKCAEKWKVRRKKKVLLTKDISLKMMSNLKLLSLKRKFRLYMSD